MLRSAEHDTVGLMALLAARGAEPVSCPTIAIQPVRDTAKLDATLRTVAFIDWLVFTSANAVRAVADRLAALKLDLPKEVRLAAVGGATAYALERHIRRADFVAPTASAASLAAQLPDVAGRDVLFPRGDLAPDALADLLRKRGARVETVVAYHTVAGAGVEELRSRVVAGQLDAIVFASPSSITFAADALARARTVTGSLPLIVCIGPTTARAARRLGVTPDATASTQSTGGIVEALERCLAGTRTSVPSLQPVER